MCGYFCNKLFTTLLQHFLLFKYANTNSFSSVVHLSRCILFFVGHGTISPSVSLLLASHSLSLSESSLIGGDDGGAEGNSENTQFYFQIMKQC